ncbi:MAG: hypothetical protein ACOYNL_04160 [Rickettsiales bacterium]
MRNDYITPVDHGVVGGAANVAAGAVGGALKKGLTATALWITGVTIAGAIALPLLVTSAPFALMAVAGAFVGSIAGLGTSWLPGGLATIFGGISGGSNASERVQAERYAAVQAKLQIEALRAQSIAQVAEATNGQKYNFPPQGSRMNAAGSRIDAGTAQGFGVTNQQQLQVG